MCRLGSRRDAATAHLWNYAGCRPLALEVRIHSLIGRRATPHLHVSGRCCRIRGPAPFHDRRIDEIAPGFIALISCLNGARTIETGTCSTKFGVAGAARRGVVRLPATLYAECSKGQEA